MHLQPVRFGQGKNGRQIPFYLPSSSSNILCLYGSIDLVPGNI